MNFVLTYPKDKKDFFKSIYPEVLIPNYENLHNLIDSDEDSKDLDKILSVIRDIIKKKKKLKKEEKKREEKKYIEYSKIIHPFKKPNNIFNLEEKRIKKCKKNILVIFVTVRDKIKFVLDYFCPLYMSFKNNVYWVEILEEFKDDFNTKRVCFITNDNAGFFNDISSTNIYYLKDILKMYKTEIKQFEIPLDIFNFLVPKIFNSLCNLEMFLENM